MTKEGNYSKIQGRQHSKMQGQVNRISKVIRGQQQYINVEKSYELYQELDNDDI